MAHDHPFEETYYFLEGRAEATFDGERYELGPGDVAWAGVGCVHGFRNLGGGPLRWLETQSPQPPGRHSYRFARDSTTYEECSDEPRSKRGTERGMSMTDVRNVIVLGGTAGIGREVAKRYADEGRTVVLTGRDAGQAEEVAKEIGGDARGSGRRARDPRTASPEHLPTSAPSTHSCSPRSTATPTPPRTMTSLGRPTSSR